MPLGVVLGFVLGNDVGTTLGGKLGVVLGCGLVVGTPVGSLVSTGESGFDGPGFTRHIFKPETAPPANWFAPRPDKNSIISTSTSEIKIGTVTRSSEPVLGTKIFWIFSPDST